MVCRYRCSRASCAAVSKSHVGLDTHLVHSRLLMCKPRIPFLEFSTTSSGLCNQKNPLANLPTGTPLSTSPPVNLWKSRLQQTPRFSVNKLTNMGNNPSKNDPLPNILNKKSSGTMSEPVAGEIDSEETSLSALSRPTGNGSNPLTKPLAHLSLNDTQAPDLESKSRPTSIPTKSAPRRRSSYASDLDIDVSSAAALSYGGQNHSQGSPTKWRISPNSLTGNFYGSSAESQRSDNLSVSPLFTASERDNSLVLSVYSVPNSPNNGKGSVNSFMPPTDGSLDPIVESSTESTPEPKVLANNAIPKSSYLKATKKDKSPDSSVSLSPPLIPQSKKLDFDIDSIIDRLLCAGRPGPRKSSRKSKDKLPMTSQEIKSVLSKSRSIFLDQPTLLKLSPPVKIVGDIHGQFYDLIRIFDSCGYPPYTNYLFLGDYVDRGYKSLESILLLLCYKIKYPENFFMLRGNHESANITKIYGFYDECKRRLPVISGSHKLWKNFIDVFNSLPIAATINDKIFCIHGGLSPDLLSLKQIEQIQRPTDIPDKGLLADLLWSDPDPLIRSFSLHNWPKNDRGVSYCFGKKHVDYFLSNFNMDLIVRGHMVVEDGYEFFNKRKLVTVFLAPNYCGDFKNYGAIMSVDKTLCCSFELLKPQ